MIELAASFASIPAYAGSFGAKPQRTRYECKTTSAQSGFSKEAAVAENSSSEIVQFGFQIVQIYRVNRFGHSAPVRHRDRVSDTNGTNSSASAGGKLLGRIVRTPADRERDAMSQAIWSQTTPM